MKKELEFLYEGNCNEDPFVFETPELQEQMDSVFSYFQKKDKKPCVNYAKIGRRMPLRWGLQLRSDC